MIALVIPSIREDQVLEFLSAWQGQLKNPNTYVLRYETFICDVETKLVEIVRFFNHTEEIAHSWLCKVTRSEKIIINDITNFKYYKNIQRLDSFIQM